MEMSAGPGEAWYPSGRDGGRQLPRPGSLTPKPGCMCCACGDPVGPTSSAPRRPQAPHDAVGVWCTKRRAGLSPSSLPPLHPSARPTPGRRAPEAAKRPRAREGVLAVRTRLCLRVPIDTMRGWDEGPQQLLGVPGTIPPLRGNSKARQTQDGFVGDIV